MCDTNITPTLESQNGLPLITQAAESSELKKDSSSSNASIYMESEEDKPQTLSEADESQDKKNLVSDKKKYHNIPNDLRLKLIDAVENKGEKIKHVCTFFMSLS